MPKQVPSYYQNQLNKVNHTGGAMFKVVNDDDISKWMNVSEESLDDLIVWAREMKAQLVAKKIIENHELLMSGGNCG